MRFSTAALPLDFIFSPSCIMDMTNLEKELNQMVEADNLYWMRNEAKCRAAKQRVSFQEFDQIVKVSAEATFKPLHVFQYKTWK